MSEADREYYVYVIGTVKGGGITGPVKIGVTSNPDSRIATLKTASPNKIEIACVFGFPNKEIATAHELAFHTVMKKHRLEGEWFSLGPAHAVAAMCRNIRAQLEAHCPDLSDEERDFAYYATGAWHAEMKVAEEQTRVAWETQ